MVAILYTLAVGRIRLGVLHLVSRQGPDPSHENQGGTMDPLDRSTYEAPAILDTFDPLEVMGAAEGAIGCGSQVAA
jgi:hypothetical protein